MLKLRPLVKLLAIFQHNHASIKRMSFQPVASYRVQDGHHLVLVFITIKEQLQIKIFPR